jgi:hypothetical protein
VAAEKRGYHRKSGLIVKRNHDLMDATRTAVMMRRFAATEPRKMSLARQRRAGGWGDQPWRAALVALQTMPDGL